MAGRIGDDVVMACMTCGAMLSPQRDRDGAVTGWLHQGQFPGVESAPLDHVSVPVPLSEMSEQVDYRCDFCYGPDPVWTHPCEGPFMMQTPTGVYDMSGPWGACEECSSLIQRHRYRDVVARWADIQMADDPFPAQSRSQTIKQGLAVFERLWPMLGARRRPESMTEDLAESAAIQRRNLDAFIERNTDGR